MLRPPTTGLALTLALSSAAGDTLRRKWGKLEGGGAKDIRLERKECFFFYVLFLMYFWLSRRILRTDYLKISY